MKTSRSGHITSKTKIMSNIIDLASSLSSLSLVMEGKFELNSFSSSSSSSLSENEEKKLNPMLISRSSPYLRRCVPHIIPTHKPTLALLPLFQHLLHLHNQNIQLRKGQVWKENQKIYAIINLLLTPKRMIFHHFWTFRPVTSSGQITLVVRPMRLD